MLSVLMRADPIANPCNCQYSNQLLTNFGRLATRIKRSRDDCIRLIEPLYRKPEDLERDLRPVQGVLNSFR